MADNVNHPVHYQAYFETEDVECINLTRQLDFCLGNCAKYLWRCGHKGNRQKSFEDLDKARWYMEDWFANHMPEEPTLVLHKGVTIDTWVLKERDDMPIKNPFAEKVRIAFAFIKPPEASENPELYDRYQLLKMFTDDYIVPAQWRLRMDAYEDKHLGDRV